MNAMKMRENHEAQSDAIRQACSTYFMSYFEEI